MAETLRQKQLGSVGHAEGKAAIWMRDNGVTGGIVFHNHPEGTCFGCNSNLYTLLPEGAKLWAVPPAGAVAKTNRCIAIPKLYSGNSDQPLAPGETR